MAENDIVGHKIVAIRKANAVELSFEMWGHYSVIPYVIELDNGVVILPSRDDEGNGPGCLFGQKDCEGLHVVPDADLNKIPH